jgi:hypothetical protein
MFELGSLLRNLTTSVSVWNLKIFSLFIKLLDPTLHRQFAYYLIPTSIFVSTVQFTILLYYSIYIFYTIIIIVIYLGLKTNSALLSFGTLSFCRCLSIASFYIFLHTYLPCNIIVLGMYLVSILM